MKVYIDEEYKCHTTNTNGAYREVETDFFDKKCASFIEGYRFIPSDETWTRSDGTVFTGEMISPWKDYRELSMAQTAYERELLAEYETALSNIEAALGV